MSKTHKHHKHHKHHIIPKPMGGTDDPENLIELSVKDHSKAHLDLYEKFGKKEDLCSYYMLSGNMEEFRHEYCSLGGKAIMKKRKAEGLTAFGRKPGDPTQKQSEASRKTGKIQGKKNAESGHMLRIREGLDFHIIGKISAEICRAKGVNSFFDPKLRKISCSKGGKIGGKKNAESGHLKRIALLPRVQKPKYWITDGEISKIHYEPNPIPEGFHKGRTVNAMENKILINDGMNNKYINDGDEIPDGFTKGRAKTKKN